MYPPKTSFKKLRPRHSSLTSNTQKGQFFNYYLFQIPKVGIYFSSKIKYRHNIAGNACWLTEMRPNHQLLFRWALVKEPRYIPSPSCYIFQVFAKNWDIYLALQATKTPGPCSYQPNTSFQKPRPGWLFELIFSRNPEPIVISKIKYTLITCTLNQNYHWKEVYQTHVRSVVWKVLL
jgi:hypothetical protein